MFALETASNWPEFYETQSSASEPLYFLWIFTTNLGRVNLHTQQSNSVRCRRPNGSSPRCDGFASRIGRTALAITAAGPSVAETDRARKGGVLSCDRLAIIATSLMLRNSNLGCSMLSHKCEEQKNVPLKKRCFHRVYSINVFLLGCERHKVMKDYFDTGTESVGRIRSDQPKIWRQ